VLLFHIYTVGFRFFDQAYAATLTIVLLLILALIAIGQFMLADKRVHYQ
jgi:sn-glycerol 3-phosphate transport system permease protein